ncbi:Hypothetical predicted protein, partial [Paramuricea clavata]
MLRDISELTTDFRHISGIANPVADALSRNVSSATTLLDLNQAITEAQQREGMRPDPFETWPPHWSVVQDNGRDIVVDTRSRLRRPVVPPSLARVVFDSLHGLAHPGVKATRKLISQRYVWPSMSRDIADWVKTCSQCQLAKIQKHNVTPFTPFSTSPSAKFSELHVDV